MPSDALFFACELLHVSTERYEVLDSGVTIKSFQNRSQNAENEQKGPLFPFAPRCPRCRKGHFTKFCPHGEERLHDGGSIVLAQTARAPARLQPYG